MVASGSSRTRHGFTPLNGYTTTATPKDMSDGSSRGLPGPGSSDAARRGDADPPDGGGFSGSDSGLSGSFPF